MAEATRPPRVPPRWLVVTAWRVHRAFLRASGGRGLRTPRRDRWGMMQLTAIGRRSGEERSVILAYLEDGANLTTLAMNGWGAGEPAWWLNLQANPHATVRTPGGTRDVVARAATGAERERLWELWRATDENLDGFAKLRPTETAVVVLEPAG